MFRNNYDNDPTTFSPQGRIFQIEYATEAVKQGSVVVGVVSNTHVVLAAIKRNAEELSSYQKKLFPIDDHVGVAIAGLASDARVLSNFMRRQSMFHGLYYGRSMSMLALADQLCDKAQWNTQTYGPRPYGVGLLIAGVDDDGPHLLEFHPSGLIQEMTAFAIGARSQMARTYLERHMDEFATASREELIRHGIRALRESLVQDKKLTVDNTSVGVVGIKPGQEGKPRPDLETFKVYDDQAVKEWIDAVADEGKKEAGETQPAQPTTEEQPPPEEQPPAQQQQQQQQPGEEDTMEVDL